MMLAGAGPVPDETYAFWSDSYHLFYRDDRFLKSSTFWGRGNGWAMGAYKGVVDSEHRSMIAEGAVRVWLLRECRNVVAKGTAEGGYLKVSQYGCCGGGGKWLLRGVVGRGVVRGGEVPATWVTDCAKRVIVQ